MAILYESRCAPKLKNRELIGKGRFGGIFKGCLQKGKSEDCNVVVKVQNEKGPLDVNSNVAKQNQNDVKMERDLQEIAAMHGISPPVAMWYKCENRTYIVMTYIEGTTLEKVLEDVNKPVSDLIDIADRLCKVLKTLHRKALIFHNDLRTDNILITQSHQVYIIDFGYATRWVPAYPEIVKDNEILSEVDIAITRNIICQELDKNEWVPKYNFLDKAVETGDEEYLLYHQIRTSTSSRQTQTLKKVLQAITGDSNDVIQQKVDTLKKKKWWQIFSPQ